MLADSLEWIAGYLESELGKGLDLNSAILTVLKDIMQQLG